MPEPLANPLAAPQYPSALPPGAGERYVRAFTDQLLASGVRHVVVCPGSRSTPLTLVFARDPRWRAWLHIDERSAGYFALGLARQLREPVALVCTSGTAAANFLPAVVEASLSRVPLLLLTADRPPELRDVGAPQTIDQVRMFGSNARWAVDMTPADGTPALERAARGVAARAAATALAAPAGPVHVNFPFREPLVERANASLPAGRAVAVTRSELAPAPEAVRAFIEAARGRRGLVIAGPESGGLPATEVAAVAAALGWPVLADPLSGLRAGLHDLDGVVETYDVLARSAAFTAGHTPEVTLRLGAAPTSKALNVWLAARPEIDSWVVDVEGAWREPDATVSTVLRGEAGPVCRALLAALAGEQGAAVRVAASWLEGWRSANVVAAAALVEACVALDEPFEGRAPIELAAALPAGATLVVGNSMPVRDVDTFLPRLARDVRIEGTRGASGIDGVVSTAAGAAAAGGGPVALLIGDLSFLHDLNGLWAVGRHGLNLTVLLVNNDGGGIFHFLPQAELAPDAFEEWWGTPHGLDLGLAVALHGGTHVRLEGSGGWADEIAAALRRPGLQVLELRTERVRNVELHREVVAHATAALERALASSPLPSLGERRPRWGRRFGSRSRIVKLDIDGLGLNVERWGSGPPLVLLHGFTGSSGGWAELAETLAPEFEVIAFDIVGHGQSDAPEDVERYAMRRVVDDLAGALKALGHERATWLGYSMGGRTALQVAVHRPDVVSALILEGGTPGLATAQERTERVAADEVLAQKVLTEGVEAFVDFWQEVGLFASQKLMPQERQARVRAGRLRNRAIGLANSLRGMGTGAQEDVRARLGEVRVPALLITGALDTKFTGLAREMAEGLPNATIAVIDDAGHAAHVERPAEFAALVLDFLRRDVKAGAAVAAP